MGSLALRCISANFLAAHEDFITLLPNGLRHRRGLSAELSSFAGPTRSTDSGATLAPSRSTHARAPVTTNGLSPPTDADVPSHPPSCHTVPHAHPHCGNL